jgi:hypothetical protein
MWIVFVASLINGCSTVVPEPIEDTEPSFDNSTPIQYDNQNSGVISLVRVGNITLGAHITDNKKAEYNELITKYRIQFKYRYSVDLKQNDGIRESSDVHGNRLWFIDTEHLQYLLRLARWQNEGREEDGFWMRARELMK